MSGRACPDVRARTRAHTHTHTHTHKSGVRQTIYAALVEALTAECTEALRKKAPPVSVSYPPPPTTHPTTTVPQPLRGVVPCLFHTLVVKSASPPQNSPTPLHPHQLINHRSASPPLSENQRRLECSATLAAIGAFIQGLEAPWHLIQGLEAPWHRSILVSNPKAPTQARKHRSTLHLKPPSSRKLPQAPARKTPTKSRIRS